MSFEEEKRVKDELTVGSNMPWCDTPPACLFDTNIERKHLDNAPGLA